MEPGYLTKRTMTSSRFKFIGNSISIVPKYPMLRFFSFFFFLLFSISILSQSRCAYIERKDSRRRNFIFYLPLKEIAAKVVTIYVNVVRNTGS